MKNIYAFHWVFCCAVALVFHACTLDKEPLIPTGSGNEQKPVFVSAELMAITHDSILARARLSTLGNLAILHYGWVWSEHPAPTLLSGNKLEFNTLAVDSFETRISGLSLGVEYYMRPFVVTGSGEMYGPEKTVTMDIPKLGDVVVVADSACFLRLRFNIQHSTPLMNYGIIYLVGEGTPTLQKKHGLRPASGISNDDFQTEMSMLNPNTAYSVRAYASTSAGTGYSRVLSVTTPLSSLVAAGFSMNTDAEIFQGADVLFANTSVGASFYSWSFGDGFNSYETSPVHRFDALGNISIRLTAKNGGCILTKDTLMHVIADPFQDYWKPLPGGNFWMGCTPGQGADCNPTFMPAHLVTLSPFSIGKTEITQGQYQAVTGNNPSYFYLCGANCPVESISWFRIVDEFIPALNRKTGRIHRLPTEAEWEYAARGGQDTQYAGSNNLDSVAWNGDPFNPDMTHPVAQKKPNAFGLFDMSGNVNEFCQDIYDVGYYSISPTLDPQGPLSGPFKVVRGGDFLGVGSYKVSGRASINSSAFHASVGFRLVRP